MRLLQVFPVTAGIASASSLLTVGTGWATPGTIGTAVGGAGSGLAASVAQEPEGLAVSRDGSVLVADDLGVVRALRSTVSTESVVAGVGVTLDGDGSKDGGGLASDAVFAHPTAVAADGNLGVLVADTGENRVWLVARSTGVMFGMTIHRGHIYALAGTGAAGFSGDGGLAADADLDAPAGLAVDGHGNAVIADTVYGRLRIVASSSGEFYGQNMVAGDIYTIAGGVGGPGPAPGDGGPAIDSGLRDPMGLTVDRYGDILVADTGDNRVRLVAAVSKRLYGQVRTAGDIYTVAGGGPGEHSVLSGPRGVAVDRAGNLVIADTGANKIRVVAGSDGTYFGLAMLAGRNYTVAGTGQPGQAGLGGPALDADLIRPVGVAVDADENLLIADTVNDRVDVVPTATGPFYGQAMAPGGLYPVAGEGPADEESGGDGGPTVNATLSHPQGVAYDTAGDLIVADTNDCRIRFVPKRSGTYWNQTMTAGSIYTIAGLGEQNAGCGDTGDGGPAAAANLAFPASVGVDKNGNLVLAGSASLRVVAATTGTFYGQAMTADDIYTLAGNQAFYGVAFARGGAIATTTRSDVVLVASTTGPAYGQQMTAGDMYVVAGTNRPGFSGDGKRALSAKLDPNNVSVDHDGDLVIADTYNDRVRVVARATGTYYGLPMTHGDIYTVAGTGKRGFAGDTGPALDADLNQPYDTTVDRAGNIVIADTLNDRIRVVAESTGTHYGQPMTSGAIYTIAGTGSEKYPPDGTQAINAALPLPEQIVPTPAETLDVVEPYDNRVRTIDESCN